MDICRRNSKTASLFLPFRFSRRGQPVDPNRLYRAERACLIHHQIQPADCALQASASGGFFFFPVWVWELGEKAVEDLGTYRWLELCFGEMGWRSPGRHFYFLGASRFNSREIKKNQRCFVSVSLAADPVLEICICWEPQARLGPILRGQAHCMTRARSTNGNYKRPCPAPKKSGAWAKGWY